MRKRAPQQRVTPDVQTGCICCASGDGKYGGPIWWNTPMDDEEGEQTDERVRRDFESLRITWEKGGRGV